jgi:hypothetical protein
MADRLFVAGMVLALVLGLGDANADPQPAPMLIPPVSPACISSPFGPRVLANHPQAGSYHYGVDLPAPPGASIVATAPGKVFRMQKKGPGGLEILVQHDGFIGIYSHLGMAAPSFAQGKRIVAEARRSVLSEERGSPSARTSISKCSSPEGRSIRLHICEFRHAAVSSGHSHLRLHRARNEANLVGFEARGMSIGWLDRSDRMSVPTPAASFETFSMNEVP